MSVTGINSIWFHTPDIERLRRFYIELLGAEPLKGDHEPIRVGHTVLVFMKGSADSGRLGLGFDVDGVGFESILSKARALGVVKRGPVEHTPFTKGLFVSDPDGREIEIVYTTWASSGRTEPNPKA
jgi:catechol 2,3-dioxygenase-like lactoylglutathione lyase family enzyme